jgi:UDP-N-acetylmuramyl tripeptide synthase
LFYVVVGCCGEKERGKRPMMTKIAAEKSDVVMLTSDNPASEDPCMVLSISGYEIITF